MKNRFFSLPLLLISLHFFSQIQTSLIPYGSNWKFKDNGSNQGTAWAGTSFNDASWASGNAELGYGEGDEATVVTAGFLGLKYITTYFRKTIIIPSVSAFNYYNLNVKRDDGVVVYINGVEVYRNNMPTGTIAYNTTANLPAGDNGRVPQSVLLPSGTLVNGSNVIAVEVHQDSPFTSDLSFDLELIGNTSPVITNIIKGPYLQKSSPTSILIKWETSTPTDSKVNYGTTFGALVSSVQYTTSVLKHEIELTNLMPYTKYYYNIGATIGVLQGDTNNYFLTPPISGTPGKYRFWVTGDCGTNSTTQTDVKNKYLQYNANRITNGWILLGDNAYIFGSDNDYNENFFGPYQNDIMKKAPIWPTPGNHDYNNLPTNQLTHSVPYYDIFSMPTNGECGGVASNHTAYYSFDYGNVHFISLDSYGFEQTNNRLYDTLSNQVNWLKQDLAANTALWTVVFFHHPPYTLGTHTSETETELVKIRERINPILERFNVDFVLCGHSHVYERSKLLKGHFGNEASFNPSLHLKSTSSGSYDNSTSCPYLKDSVNILKGTIYAVNGSSSKATASPEASWPHDAMQYSNDIKGGAQILDFDHNRADLKWLCEDGVIRDKLTMFKNVNKSKTYNLSGPQTIQLTASWPGRYHWNNSSDTTKSISYSATSNATIIVSDNFNCIADTFFINVSGPTTINDVEDNKSTLIFPNPSKGELIISQTIFAYNRFELYQYDGKLVLKKELTNSTEKINTHPFSRGTYILKLYGKDKENFVKTLFFE